MFSLIILFYGSLSCVENIVIIIIIIIIIIIMIIIIIIIVFNILTIFG